MSTIPKIHRTFHIGDLLKIIECPNLPETVAFSIVDTKIFLTRQQFEAMASLNKYHQYGDSIEWYDNISGIRCRKPKTDDQQSLDLPAPAPKSPVLDEDQ